MFDTVRRALTPGREAGPPPPRVLALASLRPLGELAGRHWVTDGSVEFKVDPRWMPDAAKSTRLNDGATYVSAEVGGALAYAAVRVYPAGAYANGGRVPAKAPRRNVSTPHRINFVALQGPLQGRTRTRPIATGTAALGPHELNEAGRIVTANDERHPAAVLVTEAEDPPVGAAAIVAALAARGVFLTVNRRDHLMASTAKPTGPELLDLLRVIEPLVAPYLATGAPPPCDECEEPAVAVIGPKALACVGHSW